MNTQQVSDISQLLHEVKTEESQQSTAAASQGASVSSWRGKVIYHGLVVLNHFMNLQKLPLFLDEYTTPAKL